MKTLILRPQPQLPSCAFKVWQTLRQNGFQCFCAGGWVRDYLLKRTSEDLDLATSATPDEVSALFDRTLALGKRFGSVVVLIEEEGHTHSVEVTTFRNDGLYFDGRRPEFITISTPSEDAQRRDFTINGLFYDPEKGEILDYIKGLEDLEKGIIRAIGEPYQRFEEDRLRILRGIRFATRLGYPIDSKTFEAMQSLSSSIMGCVSPERIWQELTKIDQDDRFNEAMPLFHSLDLFKPFFHLEIDKPTLEKRLLSVKTELPLILKISLLWDHQPCFAQECFKAVNTLKVSRKDLELLQLIEEGLLWIDEESDPLKSLKAIEWMQKAKDHLLNLSYVLSTLRPQKATQALWNNLNLHPLVKHLREEGPLFKALDLKAFSILPGPIMGKILKWLHFQAAQHHSIDKKMILNFLKIDPEGRSLVEESKKGKHL